MPHHPCAAARALLLVAVSVLLTGCVTSTKYKMAKDGTPPAQPYGWTTATPPAELTLATLIVFKGPGSWKREARWDEYVVRIANRGDKPLTVESATLVDLLGQPQFPGSDPWQLEKQSRTNWERYGKAGLKVLAGAGVVAVYVGASYAAAAGSLMAGPGAATGGAAVLTVIPLLAVVDIGVVAIMNHNNKVAVQTEFDRRRLKLPLTIAPGANAEGSFFFPMTPGPQRLVVRAHSGDTPLELVLELKPLAGLHLDSAKK